MAGDVVVIVDGVRVRRDEAAALGIKIPGAAAPPPETPDGDDTKKKGTARGKSRTVPNKGRTNVSDK